MSDLKLLLNSKQPPYLIMKLLKKTLENKTDLAQFKPFCLGQENISEKFQLSQKFYGRESEIETLLASFDKACQGTSTLMQVTGSSGMGKSTLVKEIYKPITKKCSYFIAGKFEQFQRNIPYSAIADAFRDLVRQLLTESQTQLVEWKKKILAAVGNDGQIMTKMISEIEMIIGTQPPSPELYPSSAHFNLVFQNFVGVFCQPERPLVIFLDDLQWADSASLQLMTLIMAQNQYLFLIGAYQDETTHPLRLTLENMQKMGINTKIITLSPLSLPHINQFIADTLSNALEKTLPLAQWIQNKTGGNPFFMGEFLKTLYAKKLLKISNTYLTPPPSPMTLEQVRGCFGKK